MTLAPDWKAPYFELVGDEVDGDGMSLDETYAFLTGADRSSSEAAKITVADGWTSAEEKLHPRDAKGKFTKKLGGAAKKLGKPLHINTAVIYKFQYGDGAVIAVRPKGTKLGALDERITWNAKAKKFERQRDFGAHVGWKTVDSYGKGQAYSQLSKETGWLTPETPPASTQVYGTGSAKSTGVSAAPQATVSAPKLSFASPAPKKSVATKVAAPVKATKAPKFDAAQLQEQHGDVPEALTLPERSYLAKSVKQYGKLTLSSQPSALFKSLKKVLDGHNATAQSDKKLNLLQLLRVVDEQSVWGSEKNEHRYEKKILDWLQTPSGKYTATNVLTGVTKPKAPAKVKPLTEPIDIGTPHTGPGNFEKISSSEARLLHDQNYTEPQVKAIRSYTGAGSVKINANLRNETKSPSPYARVIQSAMKPINRDIIVERSVDDFSPLGVKSYSISDVQIKSFKGKVIIDKGFVSTSIGKRSGRLSFVIKVPQGTPAAYVGDVSKFPEEFELLLAAGTKFHVEDVEEVGGMGNYRLTLRVVP